MTDGQTEGRMESNRLRKTSSLRYATLFLTCATQRVAELADFGHN